MNKLLLSGWVTKVSPVGFSAQGDPYCHVSLKEVEKNAHTGKEYVTYHHIALFGGMADEIGNAWHEGDYVWIEGALRYRKTQTGTTTPTIRVLNAERLSEAVTQPTPAAEPEDDVPDWKS